MKPIWLKEWLMDWIFLYGLYLKANFYKEFLQLRCTEHQLKVRLASLPYKTLICLPHSLTVLVSSQPTSCFAHDLPFSVWTLQLWELLVKNLPLSVVMPYFVARTFANTTHWSAYSIVRFFFKVSYILVVAVDQRRLLVGPCSLITSILKAVIVGRDLPTHHWKFSYEKLNARARFKTFCKNETH